MDNNSGFRCLKKFLIIFFALSIILCIIGFVFIFLVWFIHSPPSEHARTQLICAIFTSLITSIISLVGIIMENKSILIASILFSSIHLIVFTSIGLLPFLFKNLIGPWEYLAQSSLLAIGCGNLIGPIANAIYAWLLHKKSKENQT